MINFPQFNKNNKKTFLSRDEFSKKLGFLPLEERIVLSAATDTITINLVGTAIENGATSEMTLSMTDAQNPFTSAGSVTPEIDTNNNVYDSISGSYAGNGVEVATVIIGPNGEGYNSPFYNEGPTSMAVTLIYGTDQFGDSLYVNNLVLNSAIINNVQEVSNPIVGSQGAVNVGFTVIDPSVIAAPVSGLTFNAGQSQQVTVATFTDPGFIEINTGGGGITNETLSDYSATINWGDGNTTAGTITQPGGFASANFTVLGTHTYGDNATNTEPITITIHHDTSTDTMITENATVNVIDQLTPNGFNSILGEGSSLGGLSYGFTDSNTATTAGQFAATVAWGDGATSNVSVTGSDGNFFVNSPHDYAEEGTYHATITITPPNGATLSDTIMLPVGDAPLTAGTISTTTDGVVGLTPTTISATFSDANLLATTADYSGTINWGDSTTTTFTSADVSGTMGSYAITASHQYTTVGSEPITITINDDGGSLTTDTGSTTPIATPTLMTTQEPASALLGTAIADQVTISGGYNPTGQVIFNLMDSSLVTILFSDTENVNGDGTITSRSYTPTATGTDYWEVSYRGDSNNQPVFTGQLDEPVTIKATPTLMTTQEPASASVGTAIADQVTISGGYNPTGQVIFNLMDSSLVTILFSDTETVTGDGTITTSHSYTPTATGTDYWEVSYRGDSNNQAVFTGQLDEPVTINTATPTITTHQGETSAFLGTTINDTATVSGGFNPTGTVTFDLYNNPNGTGTPLFADTETLSGGTAASANYTPTATGTDYWVATYNGNANNTHVSSNPGSEPVTINQAPLWGLDANGDLFSIGNITNATTIQQTITNYGQLSYMSTSGRVALTSLGTMAVDPHNGVAYIIDNSGEVTNAQGVANPTGKGLNPALLSFNLSNASTSHLVTVVGYINEMPGTTGLPTNFADQVITAIAFDPNGNLYGMIREHGNSNEDYASFNLSQTGIINATLLGTMQNSNGSISINNATGHAMTFTVDSSGEHLYVSDDKDDLLYQANPATGMILNVTPYNETSGQNANNVNDTALAFDTATGAMIDFNSQAQTLGTLFSSTSSSGSVLASMTQTGLSELDNVIGLDFYP